MAESARVAAGSRWRRFIRTDRPRRVRRLTEAGIRIGDDRYGHGAGRVAGVPDHLLEGHQTYAGRRFRRLFRGSLASIWVLSSSSAWAPRARPKSTPERSPSIAPTAKTR